jgi:hypothetical protein
VPEDLVLEEILSIMSCGLRTKFAPRSVIAASKSWRCIGRQPRSCPIRFIISAYGG